MIRTQRHLILRDMATLTMHGCMSYLLLLAPLLSVVLEVVERIRLTPRAFPPPFGRFQTSATPPDARCHSRRSP